MHQLWEATVYIFGAITGCGKNNSVEKLPPKFFFKRNSIIQVDLIDEVIA